MTGFGAAVASQLALDAAFAGMGTLFNRLFGWDVPWGVWAIGYTVWAVIAAAIPGGAAYAVADVVTALFCAWMWWRKPGNRKRVTDAVGAKARSLVAALLDRLRETLQSRPGLQPVPVGAGSVFKISAREWMESRFAWCG